MARKYERGITIIAIIITIIVMLILVATTLKVAINGGLFEYARNVSEKTNEANKDEQESADSLKGLTYDDLKAVYRGNKKIEKAELYGNSVQNGIPTPSNPVEIQSVGDRAKNLLTNKFSDFMLGSYRYFKLSNTSKELRITLVDKDISVDLTGISAGFTGNGYNYADGFNWFISNGVIQTKEYHKLNSKTWHNEDRTPMMYFSFYPPTEEAWNAINARWYIQVEDGTVETSYEQYYEGYRIPVIASNGIKSSTSNIYLDEPLRKIGDYVDYIDFRNQKVIRNIGVLVLDGTENWVESTNYPNVYQCMVGFNSISQPICTHFVGIDVRKK